MRLRALGVLGLVAASLLAASVSNAAGWKVAASANVLERNGVFQGLSCSDSSSCTGVGRYLDPHGVFMPLIERWDGLGWSLQGAARTTGMEHGWFNGASCPLDGACFAVGEYATASRARLPLAEIWDGTGWRATPVPLPAGSNGAGLAAVSCTGTSACTAVGDATFAHGSRQTLIESWNGSTWTITASPDPAGAVSSELAGVSCVSASDCVAVGGSIDASNNHTTLVENLANGEWGLQPSPNPGTLNQLVGVSCTSITSCEAVGTYQPLGGRGKYGQLAAHWDGASWQLQSIPRVNLPLLAVSCSASDACTAVGNYGLYSSEVWRWNGTSWTQQSLPNSSFLFGLTAVACTAADSCLAAGTQFPSTGSTERYDTLAEAWNGSAWSVQPSTGALGSFHSELTAVSCESTGACMAVGDGGDDTSTGEQLIGESWAGDTWTRHAVFAPPATIDQRMEGVSCSAADACVAVGEDQASSGLVRYPLIRRWNGAKWTSEHSATTKSSDGDSLLSVSCPTASWCVATGTLTEAWNGGTTWSRQATPAGVFPSSVSCVSATACTAVGASTSALHWNGSSWRPQALAFPPDPPQLRGVSCLAGGECVAAGYFNYAGTPYPLAEHWDGSTWTIEPTPSHSGASSSWLNAISCASANSCIAVGGFHPFASPTKVLPLVERWNGTSWSIQSVPDPAEATDAELFGVSCDATRACTAVGDYTTPAYSYVVNAFEPHMTSTSALIERFTP